MHEIKFVVFIFRTAIWIFSDPTWLKNDKPKKEQMDEKNFSDLLLFKNYQEIEHALENGFDPNTPLEQGKPAIEWCSYSNDLKMIELLWRYGAKPTTPMTEKIIREYEKGKAPKNIEKPIDDSNNYADLSLDFSVAPFQLGEGNIRFQEGNLYTVFIPILKFILDSVTVDTSIKLDFIFLSAPLSSYIGDTICFPINPNDGYINGSVYLRGHHIPIDVKQLKFLSLEDSKLTIEISMKFDFEYEGIGFNNEEIVKIVTLELSNEADLLDFRFT